MPINIEPPPELSAKVLGAIQGALAEEKVSPARRMMKVIGVSSGSTLILALPLLLAFRGQMNMAWVLALVSWWLCLTVGFALYFHPQPRLTVPGFWSPWVFAKVLLAMTVITCLEILVCPSFVFLESPLSWSPLAGLSHVFMVWGGMPACMLFCGFLFAGIGGLITFALISKTLRGSGLREALRAAGLAAFTQIPVIGIQFWDADLRSYVPFWIAGGLLGLLFMALAVWFVTKWVGIRVYTLLLHKFRVKVD